MKILVIKVDPKMMAWLDYVGITAAQIQNKVNEVVTDALRKMVWAEAVGEEATCADCGNTLGWVPHMDTCRFNEKNLPPQLKGRRMP